MKSLVCFTTSSGQFAFPVGATLSVRRNDGLVDLPAPRADVVGVLPGDPPISVLATLGGGGNHVLVVEAGDVRFAVTVLEVLGVRTFADDQIGPPPKGQTDDLIAGTLGAGADLVLIVDAHALAARL